MTGQPWGFGPSCSAPSVRDAIASARNQAFGDHCNANEPDRADAFTHLAVRTWTKARGVTRQPPGFGPWDTHDGPGEPTGRHETRPRSQSRRSPWLGGEAIDRDILCQRFVESIAPIAACTFTAPARAGRNGRRCSGKSLGRFS